MSERKWREERAAKRKAEKETGINMERRPSGGPLVPGSPINLYVPSTTINGERMVPATALDTAVLLEHEQTDAYWIAQMGKTADIWEAQNALDKVLSGINIAATTVQMVEGTDRRNMLNAMLIKPSNQKSGLFAEASAASTQLYAMCRQFHPYVSDEAQRIYGPILKEYWEAIRKFQDRVDDGEALFALALKYGITQAFADLKVIIKHWEVTGRKKGYVAPGTAYIVNRYHQLQADPKTRAKDAVIALLIRNELQETADTTEKQGALRLIKDWPPERMARNIAAMVKRYDQKQ